MCISHSESECVKMCDESQQNGIFGGFNEHCGDFVTVNFLDRT